MTILTQADLQVQKNVKLQASKDYHNHISSTCIYVKNVIDVYLHKSRIKAPP